MSETHHEKRKRRIEIPEPTAEQIERRIEGTEYESVEEYVADALDRLLWELRRRERQSSSPQDDEAAASVDDDLEEHLDALGYL